MAEMQLAVDLGMHLEDGGAADMLLASALTLGTRDVRGSLPLHLFCPDSVTAYRWLGRLGATPCSWSSSASGTWRIRPLHHFKSDETASLPG